MTTWKTDIIFKQGREKVQISSTTRSTVERVSKAQEQTFYYYSTKPARLIKAFIFSSTETITN